MMRQIRVFTDKYPLLGPIVYILSLQYFAVQWIVAAGWHDPVYSLSRNTISDLGNTVCGMYGDRYVCSPHDVLMNGSFIALGLTMALGSWLIYTEFARNRGTVVGFSLMGLAGLGTIIVGCFPENTVAVMHVIGASLAFGPGNASLVVLAVAITQARLLFRIYSVVSGVFSLVALGLFVSHTYLGLGEGGMERLVSYPLTAWLILFGIYMSMTRLRAR